MYIYQCFFVVVFSGKVETNKTITRVCLFIKEIYVLNLPTEICDNKIDSRRKLRRIYDSS